MYKFENQEWRLSHDWLYIFLGNLTNIRLFSKYDIDGMSYWKFNCDGGRSPNMKDIGAITFDYLTVSNNSIV